MADQLRSGFAGNWLARITPKGRLSTRAVVIDESRQSNVDGRAFNINSGYVNLTSANESGILYVKNGEDEDLHITTIIVGCKATTNGASNEVDLTVVRNPTSVSFSATVPVNSNRNYGSPATLADSTLYLGAEAATVTGGDDHIKVLCFASARTAIPIDEVLEKGNAMALKIDPPASNTSMDVYVALVCHLEDPDTQGV